MLEGLVLGWMVQAMRMPPVLPSGQLADKAAAVLVTMDVFVQEGTKARRTR